MGNKNQGTKNQGNTPFYDAFDKKKKVVKHNEIDDDFEFEDEYYSKKKREKKANKSSNTNTTNSANTSNTTKNGNRTTSAKKADYVKKTENATNAKKSNHTSVNDNAKSAPSDRKKETYKNTRPELKREFIKGDSKGKAYFSRAYDAYRIEPKCGASSKCGGCQLQHLSYEGQLVYKQRQVESLLSEFGKVSPIVGMKDPYHYRNKIHATFSYDKKGKIIAGIYEEESHHVIATTDCIIQDQRANAIIQTIVKLMPSFKMTPYDEDYGTGFLRHVLIRTSSISDEVMVVIVGGNPIMPSKNNFAKALTEAHPYISTVVFNVNSRNTSMVLGPNETVITGKGYIEDALCGTKFRISPKSFYQVNSVQADKLFKRAIEMAKIKSTDNVLDAYCGIGTIGLIASKKAGHVIGVELNKDAVADANYNSKLNEADNIEFYQGDAGEFMVEMAAEDETVDIVFLDPPRSGSSDDFLKSLVKLAPKTVVYISCNPETLARDLKYLTSNGYSTKEMVPFDLFPFTGHVETVVLMSRVKE